MPIQFLVLCDSVSIRPRDEFSQVNLKHSDQFVAADLGNVFTQAFASGSPTTVSAVLAITPNPIEDEEFHFQLHRFDGDRKDWREVEHFQKSILKVSPCQVPYMCKMPLVLPLDRSAIFCVRVASFLDSLKEFEEPESEVQYAFSVFDR